MGMDVGGGGEDAVVRARLRGRSLAVHGEPPAKRVARGFAQFCAAVGGCGEGEGGARDAREAVLRDLAILEGVAERMSSEARVLAAEEAGHGRAREELEAQLESRGAAVVERLAGVEEAQQWRREQEAFESIKSDIMRFPSQAAQRQATEQVQAEMREIEGLLRNAVDRVAERRGALEAFAEGVEALGREFEADAGLARALQGGGGGTDGGGGIGAGSGDGG